MGQLGGNIASAVGSGGSVLGGFGQDLTNKNVVDPRQAQWGDLDGTEKAARIAAPIIKGGLGGFGQMAGGLKPAGGGFMPQVPVPPTPLVQQPIYDPRGDVGNNGSRWAGDSQTSAKGPKGNMFAFYGG